MSTAASVRNVTVFSFGKPSLLRCERRAARIPGHRTAEDRRLLLVDGSVGDRHPQFDGAHDRVGNNRRRAGSSLRHGSPRWRGRSSVGTRIVTHRGPTSAQRHDPTARISADHRCTLLHEEPLIVADPTFRGRSPPYPPITRLTPRGSILGVQSPSLFRSPITPRS